MSPSGRRIGAAVAGALRRVRVQSALAVALCVAAIAPVALMLAWVLGPARWGPRGVGPLLLIGAGLVGAAVLALGLWRRWVAAVDAAAVAAAAERRQGLPAGSLRGVLELARELPRGGSPALFLRSEREMEGRIAGQAPTSLAGDLGDRVRRRLVRVLAVSGLLAGLVLVAGLAAPDRARAAWAPLLDPVAHLRGPVLPALIVSPGDADVARGGTVALSVEAPMRTRVTLHWRSTGDVPRERALVVERGRGSTALGPVDAAVRYWVSAPDGATSDTFRLRPLDPLLLTDLAIEVTYPPHTGRAADHYEGDAPPLRVPAGSRLRIQGRATQPLRAAGLRHEDGRERAASVRGAGFELGWRPAPAESGRWEWRLGGERDAVAASLPAPLDLTVLADAPPEVRITLPAADTLMPPSLRQQVVADASDDYGVETAELVLWRVGAAGDRGAEIRAPVQMESGVERALARAVLDAQSLPLAPGDAVHYRVEVRDNSPAGQIGRSATQVLRLPGLAELRETARAEADDVLREAESLAERARDLETATRDVSRRASGSNRSGRGGAAEGRPSDEGRLGFEEANEARRVLEQHEDVLSDVDRLRERMDALERALESAGLRDPELEKRLEELRSLYAELDSPALQEEVRSLQQALSELDPEAVQNALQRLAERQDELRRQIEESLELMRRAAAEQEMNALAREAEEIAAQQAALAESLREEADGDASPGTDTAATAPPDSADGGEPEPAEAGRPSGEPTPGDSAAAPRPSPASPSEGQQGQSPSGSRAEQQEELEERTEQVTKSMLNLQQQLLQIGEQEAAQQTGSAQQKGKAAQESMQQAGQQARQNQGSQAAQSGQRAASQMADAAQTLDSARQRMSQQWEDQAQEAVRQATQEALSLAQREEALRQQMAQAQQQGGGQGETLQQMRSDQAALQQGLQQLGQNLSEAGERSASLNREVGQSLARAMLNMQQTMQALQDGQQMPVQQAEQTVESLNQLAMSLIQNDAQMQQAQSGGAQNQAMQQLSQLAQDQASLNGQAGALAPLDLSPRTKSGQLQQLSQRQRAIARRVGSVSEMMGGRENVLGRLDQLSSEAEAIARELAGGRLDPEVLARQERLFHRLLDAGRTLERDELSEERVGQRAESAEVATPDALDAALLDARLRYAVPTAEQMRALPPAYRRLILEYFDRLNRSAAGGPAGDGGGP